jgi:hypothetical protein
VIVKEAKAALGSGFAVVIGLQVRISILVAFVYIPPLLCVPLVCFNFCSAPHWRFAAALHTLCIKEARICQGWEMLGAPVTPWQHCCHTAWVGLR